METENLWFGEASGQVYYRDPASGESEPLGYLDDGPPDLLPLDLWAEWLGLVEKVHATTVSHQPPSQRSQR